MPYLFCMHLVYAESLLKFVKIMNHTYLETSGINKHGKNFQTLRCIRLYKHYPKRKINQSTLPVVVQP